MNITSIPTAARGLVRAFIKGQPGFARWLDRAGIDSRDVKNQHLLDYAAQNGLMPQVAQIIADATGAPPAVTAERTKQAEQWYEQAVKDSVPSPQAPPATVEEVVVYETKAVLAGLDQLLSPLVKAELEKALAPLVDAANKPAVVQEVERIVEKTITVNADGVSVAVAPSKPALPDPIKTGAQMPFGKLFGVKGATGAYLQRPISLWNSHGAAPQIDIDYVVDPVVMGLLATAAEDEINVWVVGPSGSGKTTLPQQFAAYTGRPFTRLNFTRQTEVADLTGGDAAKNGSTYWQDGALIAAMKVPGMVILIDEPTFAPPGVQAILQAVTDNHRTYTVHATGEIVKCAPGVTFVIADNTNGSGDETGQYAGTNQSNGALVNRFGRMVRVDYLTKAQETLALVNRTRIPAPAAAHVVDFFHKVRKLPEMEGVIMSIRQMVAFVGVVKDGFPAQVAMDTAILNKLPGTERAAVQTMATLDWLDNFDQLFSGTAKPVTNQPDSGAGAKAFDDDVSASLNRA